MKRILDIAVALGGLTLLAPFLLLLLVLIWLQDFRSPLYIAPRVGRAGRMFRMVKLRSMVSGADRSGVDSTAAGDARITPLGHFIRRYKLDEIPQLLNVLAGHMSLVGPRPNVERDVRLYTDEERRLLDVRPGMTDLSSIVFSDEGDVLEGAEDPDLEYNRVIRPWKSRLGLFYVDHHDLFLDLRIIAWTAVAIVSRPRALRGVVGILQGRGADELLTRSAAREAPLEPFPPPGADAVVESRDVSA